MNKNNLKHQENIFIPIRPNIMRCVRFWREQSLRGDLMDKGGSFNVNLYLSYLEIINEQVLPIKTK